jgi:NAD+ synthase
MNRTSNLFALDPATTVDKLSYFIKQEVFSHLRRKGAVIGISGGVDSAVCAAIAVRALASERVLGVILPEKESSPISERYARKLADQLGTKTAYFNITPILDSLGVYAIREAIVKSLFPEYDASYRFRIILPQNLLDKNRLNIYSLEIQDGKGQLRSKRLDAQSYRKMVAATDMKQRVRMTMLYYYAEMNHYAVIGTTNRSEMMQGFYVKYGDGGVDLEPLAHLYKTQVYQLASYLKIPDEIIERQPSPDTFNLEVSDKEFYFCLPYNLVDLFLYAFENKLTVADLQNGLHLDREAIQRGLDEVEKKFKATEYLRKMPATYEF